MKIYTVCLFAATVAILSACSGEIYVSPLGDDSNPGTKKEPLRSLEKATGMLKPGDVCYLMEGVYRETLRPENNGSAEKPIVFRAVKGDKVVISAMEELEAGAMEEAVISYPVDWSLGHLNMVNCDGEPLILARWPNKTSPAYMELEPASIIAKGSSPQRIRNDTYPESWTSQSLAGATAWVNAEHKWSSWTSPVTAYEPETRTIMLEGFGANWWVDERHNPGRDHRHYGTGDFFVAGARELLDVPGEYYLDEEGKTLYLIPPEGKDPAGLQIEIKKRELAVDLSGASYIHLEGIDFSGAAMNLSGAEGCLIQGAEVQHFCRSFGLKSTQGIGENTGIVLGGNHNTIRDCRIYGSDGNGILLSGVKNAVINCEIFDINYLGSHSCASVKLTGKEHLVSHNSIYNTGRVCISMKGGGHEIQFNHIYNPGRNSEDLGVLKSGGLDADNLMIHHNVIHNDNGKFIGIYFDNYTNNIIAHHNVVWGMKDGVRSNRPGHFHIIYNNTLIPDINNKWGPWPGKRDQAGVVIVNNVYRDTLMAKEDVYAAYNLRRNFSITSPEKVPAFQEQSEVPGFPSYVGAIEVDGELFSYGHNFDHPPEISFEKSLPSVRNYLKNACFDYLNTYEGLYTQKEKEEGAIPHWDPIKAGTARAEYFPGFNFPGNPEHRFSMHGYSLQLEGEHLNGVVQTVGELVPGTKYRFMAFLKTDGEAEVRFTIKAGEQVLAQVESSELSFEEGSNWKFIHCTFQPGGGQEKVRLEILNHGPGTAYVDDAGILPDL